MRSKRLVVLRTPRGWIKLKNVQTTHLCLAQAVVDANVNGKKHLTIGRLELLSHRLVELDVSPIDTGHHEPQDVDIGVESIRNGAHGSDEGIHTVDGQWRGVARDKDQVSSNERILTECNRQRDPERCVEKRDWSMYD